MYSVAPYLGAWIEIRKSGLNLGHVSVAPYLGAWIEIFVFVDDLPTAVVAPYLGAWIEITFHSTCLTSISMSHPTWVRGLKFPSLVVLARRCHVAPYLGAWIEIICPVPFK